MGYYYVHVDFINFLSLIGLTGLLRIFTFYCTDRKREVAVLSMLLPSVLFWGSGLLKDPLLIFVFGSLCYTIFKIHQSGPTKNRLLLAFILLVGLMFIKLYVLLIVFPGVLVWLLSRKMNSSKTALLFLGAYTIYFSAAFNFYRVNEKYNVAEIIYYKQRNFYNMAEFYGAKSVIEIPRLEPNAFSILKNSPVAFFTTIIRPFVTDVKGNPLILMSAIENILILVILLLGLFYLRKKPGDSFLLFCSIYLFLLYVLIGLITPVLGAMVRYRVPGLPFLMFLIVYYSDFPDLIPKRFKKALKKEPNL
jgi:hypothetical protein